MESLTDATWDNGRVHGPRPTQKDTASRCCMQFLKCIIYYVIKIEDMQSLRVIRLICLFPEQEKSVQ